MSWNLREELPQLRTRTFMAADPIRAGPSRRRVPPRRAGHPDGGGPRMRTSSRRPTMASQTSSPSQVPAILAATDFSATAAVALEWAAELARQQGARLELIHAVTIPPSMPGYFPPNSLDFSEEPRQAAESRLAESAAALQGKGAGGA